MATAFGDSDDEGNDFDDDVIDNRDDVEGPGSISQESIDQPSLPVAHPQPQRPFDMVDFIQKSSVIIRSLRCFPTHTLTSFIIMIIIKAG